MIFWMSVTAIGSMPANGSSSRMNFGEMTSARVISARRRSPPDSVWAGDCASGVRFSSASSSRSRARRVGAVEPHRLEDRQDVLLDRQAAEDRRLLRQVADALARPDVHRIVGDVVAVELDAPRVGRGQADRHVERRGLAGAVRAEQADDFARRDVEVDAAHDGAAAVGLRQVVGAECGHQWAERAARAAAAARTVAVAALRLRADLLVAVDDDPIGALDEGQRAADRLAPHSSTIFTGAPVTT